MDTFGEFIFALRKEKGMTQAELAEKLGVTNKAVSKWETGEAMPETGLLLPLSEIFGVTVDELLTGRRAGERQEEPEKEVEKQPDFPEGHLFTRGKDEPRTVSDYISGVICAVVMLCGSITYLCLGALAQLWTPYWVILPVCAMSCGIIGIICNLCDREKCRFRRANGKNPYTEGACGLIMLSCVIAYLLLGALAGLWHPCWIIVAAGGALCGIVGAVGNYTAVKKK